MCGGSCVERCFFASNLQGAIVRDVGTVAGPGLLEVCRRPRALAFSTPLRKASHASNFGVEAQDQGWFGFGVGPMDLQAFCPGYIQELEPLCDRHEQKQKARPNQRPWSET